MWNPDSTVLAKNHTEFQNQLIRTNNILKDLRVHITSLAERSLGLPRDFLIERTGDKHTNIRLAYYPRRTQRELLENKDNYHMRSSSHIDSFGITLLSLDPEHPHGLQVQIDDQWVSIPYRLNSFVLNDR
eukprot:UN22068